MPQSHQTAQTNSDTASLARPAKRLRLLLGDQLNHQHSWFEQVCPDTLYVIAELKQETDYVSHHVQKICAFFAAMQAFATHLKTNGHRVCHLNLHETSHYKGLNDLLSALIEQHQCRVFEFQHPDEYRLREQLLQFAKQHAISAREYSSEHFLLPFEALGTYFSPNQHVRMEAFYRKMRKRFNILMHGSAPLGGEWNYDSANRQALKRDDLSDIPAPLLFHTDVRPILQRLATHQVSYFGQAQDHLLWPVTRAQALHLLGFFCEHCLCRFGTFQDAMTGQSQHAWSLYHSRLSFALNSKLLHPMEVINAAIEAYHSRPNSISLPQVEGFVRQILGWREYVRGMYWSNMPSYRRQNALGAERKLPAWFWTADTKMHCLSMAIKQSLEYAYAHHIQRLMITGNFSLLAGLKPEQVDAWYLGIYIDAIEWVELPNTRGMALFADNGWIATKPYAASGNYVNKMSDYCKHCHYQVKLKTGENACPLNSLYWHFIQRHYERFKHNPRMAFPIKNWDKQSPAQKTAIVEQAEYYLANLESL